jgi:hypothetical protein
MNLRARIIAACMILAAFAAGPCAAAPQSAQANPSSEAKMAAALTSFGTGLSANELDALSLHAPGSGQAMQLQPSSFAASLALTPTFALDGGYRIDTARRFASYDQALDPLRDTGSFLALADGGRYAGVTAIANSNLGLRLGVSNWTGRLDNTVVDGAAIGLPAVYDTSHVNSVLAGVTWNFKDWVGVGFNAISSFRSGMPLGYASVAPLTQSAATQALQISARVNIGSNWVTTAAFGEGLTQLRQRDGVPTSLDAQTFAITVAKRGVFGGDAVGFSFSRPAPGSVGGVCSLGNATDELPPVMAAAAARAPETDFQLGYVTSFLGGRLALQTNAAFQVNPQGQSGASAVSLLSRAKIKF